MIALAGLPAQSTGFEITSGMWLSAALGILIVGVGTLLRLNVTLYNRSGRMLQTLYGDEKTDGLVKEVGDLRDIAVGTNKDLALMARDMVNMDKRHEEMAKNLGAILRGEAPFVPRARRQP